MLVFVRLTPSFHFSFTWSPLALLHQCHLNLYSETSSQMSMSNCHCIFHVEFPHYRIQIFESTTFCISLIFPINSVDIGTRELSFSFTYVIYLYHLPFDNFLHACIEYGFLRKKNLLFFLCFLAP